ncbi:uncharacterized protein Sfri_3691 [Folsomia candida]|uniref:Uncharacterized protein YetH n=1 Tax=Folsomia candida TaxID=158441 RepID=A0A226E0E4_FOLCA|nr:uncharacterized protein Sfri_3691 [Folsomia candida]OXA50494.1 Uncharacterized protein YetH [Folsomia candida]
MESAQPPPPSKPSTNKPHQFIGSMALVVKDYDEAIAFFTQKLDFELICDEVQTPPTKRWVLVRPPSNIPNNIESCCLLLARAVGEVQEASIGNQTGGRVFMFLHTDDFWRDYEKYTERGIKFVRPPTVEPYGTVAVFQDISGNLWDLVQMNEKR